MINPTKLYYMLLIFTVLDIIAVFLISPLFLIILFAKFPYLYYVAKELKLFKKLK